MKQTRVETSRLNGKSATPLWFRMAEIKSQFIYEIIDPVCDLGEVNPMKGKLEKDHHVEIDSIDDIDFDYDLIPGEWGTIICYDLIEHLANSLFFMHSLHNALQPGGIVYIHLVNRPSFYLGEKHYYEIPRRQFGWLCEAANFAIEKEMKCPIPLTWRHYVKGLRPIVRLALRPFLQMRLYKLRKEL